MFGKKIAIVTMSSYENGPKRTVDSCEDLEAMVASDYGAAGHIRSMHHLHGCLEAVWRRYQDGVNPLPFCHGYLLLESR